MNRLIIRTYLGLFILAILWWLLQSNAGFILLLGTRGQELPEWLQSWNPLARALFINFTFQIFYWLIGLGLVMEWFSPEMELSWNRRAFPCVLSAALVLDTFLTLRLNSVRDLFGEGWYDTIFYGPGFGILFLLTVNAKTRGMRIVLWSRLLEVGGFFLGFLYLPAALGMLTGGGDHLKHGLAHMMKDRYFWSDFLVQAASAAGAVDLLLRSAVRPFWILFFGGGAILVGFAVALLTLRL